MTQKAKIQNKQGKLSALFGALVAASTAAFADEVTLRSNDGSIVVSGELLEIKPTHYVIQSSLGPINVANEGLTCTGDACPAEVREVLQPITWSVSLWGKRRAFTEHVEKLGELVSEKTDGKFRLNISYGGLAKSRENLDGIASGAFEMAQFCAGYHPEKNPSITVLELPFLGISTLEQEIEASMAVYSHPATQADLARWNATLLMPSPLPQYNIAGIGSPPMSIDDFAQMRVRATGGIANAIASLGAELVSMPATEVGGALDDGTVTAVTFAPHAHMAFGTAEKATWWTTNLNPGTVNCPVVVNTDALDGLPRAYRYALDTSIDEALDHYVANYNGATMEAWSETLNDRAIIQLTLNDEFRSEIFDQVASPTALTWIAEQTSNGLPAYELYELVVQTARE